MLFKEIESESEIDFAADMIDFTVEMMVAPLTFKSLLRNCWGLLEWFQCFSHCQNSDDNHRIATSLHKHGLKWSFDVQYQIFPLQLKPGTTRSIVVLPQWNHKNQLTVSDIHTRCRESTRKTLFSLMVAKSWFRARDSNEHIHVPLFNWNRVPDCVPLPLRCHLIVCRLLPRTFPSSFEFFSCEGALTNCYFPTLAPQKSRLFFTNNTVSGSVWGTSVWVGNIKVYAIMTFTVSTNWSREVSTIATVHLNWARIVENEVLGVLPKIVFSKPGSSDVFRRSESPKLC
jgi:hypothetical protein